MLEIVKPFSSDPAIFKIRLKLFMAGFFVSLNTLFCVVEFLMVVIFKRYQIPSIPGHFPSFLLNQPPNKTPNLLFFFFKWIPQLKSYIIWFNLNINVSSPAFINLSTTRMFRRNKQKKTWPHHFRIHKERCSISKWLSFRFKRTR